jgi:hypothetical protein
MGDSSESLTGGQMRKRVTERDRKISECKAKAKRQRENLTAREAKAYQDPELEERQDGSLMMILTTWRPH